MPSFLPIFLGIPGGYRDVPDSCFLLLSGYGLEVTPGGQSIEYILLYRCQYAHISVYK